MSAGKSEILISRGFTGLPLKYGQYRVCGTWKRVNKVGELHNRVT